METDPELDGGTMTGAHNAPEQPSSSIDPAARQRLATHFGLTDREMQIALDLFDGKSGKAIARHRSISIHTVDNHIRRIFLKLRVNRRGSVGVTLLMEVHRPGNNDQ